jgi:hypothetical protein
MEVRVRVIVAEHSDTESKVLTGIVGSKLTRSMDFFTVLSDSVLSCIGIGNAIR